METRFQRLEGVVSWYRLLFTGEKIEPWKVGFLCARGRTCGEGDRGPSRPVFSSGKIPREFSSAEAHGSAGGEAAFFAAGPFAKRDLFSPEAPAHRISALRHGEDRIGGGEEIHLPLLHRAEADQDFLDRPGPEADGVCPRAHLQRDPAGSLAGQDRGEARQPAGGARFCFEEVQALEAARAKEAAACREKEPGACAGEGSGRLKMPGSNLAAVSGGWATRRVAPTNRRRISEKEDFMPKERVLSGMRPTGKLHLGNLVGALDNWKRLQEEYECFFFAADWHALTTEYTNTGIIQENIRDIDHRLAERGALPRKECSVCPIEDQGTCRAAPAPVHDHPASLAGARSHLQGSAAGARRPRPFDLRFFRVPPPADRGHHHVQSPQGSRGDRPGPPRGTLPRGGPPVQLISTERCSPSPSPC